MRRIVILATLTGSFTLLMAGTAGAGAVSDQFRAGAFGLSWSATKGAVKSKYPGGKWDADEQGRPRYCAASRQVLLKLPAQHQTRELCFLMGADGELASATARMDASLPALLAVVNRSRTMFGDFDAGRRPPRDLWPSSPLPVSSCPPLRPGACSRVCGTVSGEVTPRA